MMYYNNKNNLFWQGLAWPQLLRRKKKEEIWEVMTDIMASNHKTNAKQCLNSVYRSSTQGRILRHEKDQLEKDKIQWQFNEKKNERVCDILSIFCWVIIMTWLRHNWFNMSTAMLIMFLQQNNKWFCNIPFFSLGGDGFTLVTGARITHTPIN